MNLLNKSLNLATTAADKTPDFKKNIDFIDDIFLANGFTITAGIFTVLAFVGLFVILVFALVMFIRKISISGLETIVSAIFFIPAMLGMVFMVIGIGVPRDKNYDQINELQTWAEKRYVLNLTEKQAERLLNLSHNEKSNEKIEGVKVTNAYGEKLQLILTGKNNSWKLVDISQEIESTGY